MTGFLKANYHTHTYRCQHAYGSEREYIEAAIRMGIAELGFSDHVPCPFKDGYVSGIRMTMEQAPEYVYAIRDTLRKLYDTELMQGGGHIRGYAIEGEAAKQVTEAFAAKQESCGGFLFAVGDGNHSLATAKTCWENIKKSGKFTEEQLKTHPARHALVEICNLHSEALEFKPIHRLLTNVDVKDMLSFFEAEITKQGLESAEGDEIVFEYVESGATSIKNSGINITNRGDRLPVEILQGILDKYLETHGNVEIDYIHGDEALHGLVKETKGCGIFLQSIDKSTLFPAINAGGVLPRKTFSIGEANEKRYYMECHKISM